MVRTTLTGTSTNLVTGLPSQERQNTTAYYPEHVEPSEILCEYFDQIATAYYDRVPGQSTYVESDGQTYLSNSIGHTGPEPGKVTNLFIGCSNTSGIGLKFEQTWSYKVAKEIGGSYATLGFVGGSVGFILQNALSYIIKFGKPKRIFFLSPDFYRVNKYGTSNPTIHKYRVNNESDYVSHIQKFDLICEPIAGKNRKIVDINASYALSLSTLNSFIKTCEISGIELLWSTWSNQPDYGFSSFYPSFVPLGFTEEDLELMSCHQEESLEDNFKIAGDNSHFGAHYQSHVADRFIARLKESSSEQ